MHKMVAIINCPLCHPSTIVPDLSNWTKCILLQVQGPTKIWCMRPNSHEKISEEKRTMALLVYYSNKLGGCIGLVGWVVAVKREEFVHVYVHPFISKSDRMKGFAVLRRFLSVAPLLANASWFVWIAGRNPINDKTQDMTTVHCSQRHPLI